MSFILRRLAFYLVAAWVAITLNFFIPRAVPGNPVQTILSKYPDLTPQAYKALSHVERDFRHLKVDDIDLRPIHHRLEARVRSHVFICMLASYLVWHLREALAPLTFTDEAPPLRANPVAPAQRSAGARAKAAAKENNDGEEVRGFRELLEHLGTLTRNTMRTTTETTSEFELLATPTPTQRRVFELLGSSVPLKLS